MGCDSKIESPGEGGGKQYWFVFQDTRLLIRRQGDGAAIPLVRNPGDLEIQPLRTQYLGRLDGCACRSAELAKDCAVPAGMSLEPLRSLWGLLPENTFWQAGLAFQVMDFDRSHQFCGRCGEATRDGEGERSKVCPRCGLTVYPRISPAIIVAITRGDRILLARASRFPAALYSVIAGFVDPGESLEECVHREVAEEVGISVTNLRYFGSQSWPFPHSLMVGFTAEHAAGEIRIDRREIVEAGWFTADNMPRIPDKVSISRRLIDWFLAR
jgi:NAD+ diphosphatase